MRSGMALDGENGLGLAVVRLEALATGAPLICGESRLTPVRPDWMVLPQTEETAPTPTPAG
jgi:hypothetical protein